MRFINYQFLCRLLLAFLFLFTANQAQAADNADTRAGGVAVASSLALVYITNPIHADRMTVEVGGGDDVYVFGAGAQWDWKEDLLEFLGFSLDTYFQFDYTRWQSTEDSTQEGANNSLGFTPVFKFTREISPSITTYFETSVGVCLISNTEINDKDYGSNFQFRDTLGVGAFFGKNQQWGLSYKFQHISNNAIKLPNNGINFHLMNISYRY